MEKKLKELLELMEASGIPEGIQDSIVGILRHKSGLESALQMEAENNRSRANILMQAYCSLTGIDHEIVEKALLEDMSSRVRLSENSMLLTINNSETIH